MVLTAAASKLGGDQVAWWAQFSAAVNAAWSRHMGYAFLVVDEHHPSIVQQGTDVDVRFAKVRAPSGITQAPYRVENRPARAGLLRTVSVAAN